MKLLVHSIQGPENAVNGVFPIGIASMAAEAGHEVNIFLAGKPVTTGLAEMLRELLTGWMIKLNKITGYSFQTDECLMRKPIRAYDMIFRVLGQIYRFQSKRPSMWK